MMIKDSITDDEMAELLAYYLSVMVNSMNKDIPIPYAHDSLKELITDIMETGGDAEAAQDLGKLLNEMTGKDFYPH